MEPNGNGVFFVARRGLVDAGRLRSYADLNGLKIAIPDRRSSLEYVVTRALEAGGLTTGAAELVVLPFPAMLAALATQGIDMALLPEPLATQAVHNASAVKWRGVADVVPGFQLTVVAFSPRLVAQRDVAARWMTAYLRGIRDYNDAFVKNTHRAQIAGALASLFSIDPKLFDDMGFMHIDPDGKLNLASMEDLTRWYVKMGYLSDPVDLARIVDASFVEAAVADLGPYP